MQRRPTIQQRHLGPSVRLAPEVQDALAQLTLDQRSEFLMMYRNEYECVRCNRTFREIDNIGAWQCTQHGVLLTDYDSQSLSLLTNNREPRWPCCNALVKLHTPSDRGCVPCDHTVSGRLWMPESDNYDVPEIVVTRFFGANVRPGMLDTNVHVRSTGDTDASKSTTHNRFRNDRVTFGRVDANTFHARRMQALHKLPNAVSFIPYASSTKIEKTL